MKKTWKRDYGDGYETDDSVLWVDKEPTDTIISPVSSACYVLYVDGDEIRIDKNGYLEVHVNEVI